MIQVFEDADQVAAAAADRLIAYAAAAIADQGRFRQALSGGTTPERLYQRLAATPWRERVDWERVVVLFADERAVAPDDPASNYHMVKRSLLAALAPHQPAVIRMRAEFDDLEAAAREYENELQVRLDCVVLGVGPDGHIASLFPRKAAVEERARRCVVVLDSPKPPPRRLTVTPGTLEEARGVLVLATGGEKAQAVARALTPGMDPRECPAALVQDREWLVDRPAASGVA